MKHYISLHIIYKLWAKWTMEKHEHVHSLCQSWDGCLDRMLTWKAQKLVFSSQIRIFIDDSQEADNGSDLKPLIL